MNQATSRGATMSLAGLVMTAWICVPSISVPSTSAKQSTGSTLTVRKEFDLPTPGAAVAVAWSPDGAALAAASNFGGVLTVWDRSGHRINQIKRVGGGPTLGGSIAFVNGSSQLAFPPPATDDNSAAISLWDVRTGAIIRTESGPQPGEDYPLNRAEHFMTSPDQRWLAAATRGNRGDKNFDKNVFIYDTRSWQVVHTAKLYPGVTSLCVFAQGRLVGLGSISVARVFVLDTVSGATVGEFAAGEDSKYGSVSLGAIAGSPAGDLIMTGVGTVVLNGEYYASPEQGAWASSLSSSEAVRMFRIKDGTQIASFKTAKAPIRQAMWDPKGRYVAFIDNARGLFLWAPWRNDWYQKMDLPSASLSLAIASDGGRIAVTTDQGVRVYSVH